MPPQRIEVAKTDDPRDLVHRAVQTLAEGGLVAVPTETVYGIAASAMNAEAVNKLAEAKQRDTNSPFSLTVKSAEDAEDYAPGWSPTARRMARRCWPGPVTLVVDAEHEEGLARRLPDGVAQYFCPNGTLGLRSPANRVLQDVMRMLAGPIALTSANKLGDPEATTAQQCIEAVGDHLALVIDDGPSHYGQESSVVNVSGGKFDVIREGVVGRQTLERLSRVLVVFVCTGNTCRSPLAEGLMRRHLAEQLGVQDDELESRGVIVASAGLAASPGSPASAQTAELLRERGISIDQHSAQPLSEHLVRQADLLIALTQGHKQSILEVWPEASSRVTLVDKEQRDISDPIGGSLEVYRRCAEQIERGIEGHAQTVLDLLPAPATDK